MIKRNPLSNGRRREGFTLIELLIVIAIIAILAALAIPNLLASRKAANERNAIHRLREIVSAQALFKQRRMGGADRYGTLAEMENTPVGSETLIGWPTPGTYIQSGYEFEELEAPTELTYCLRAKPVAPGDSGDNFFAVTEDGQIKTGTALPADRAAIATMSQIQ